MKFEHRFTVNTSQEAVARFHASAASLKIITPAPITVRYAPDPMFEGDEIHFTLWMPFPVRWHGRIRNVSIDGFDDIQEDGPFEQWHHRDKGNI